MPNHTFRKREPNLTPEQSALKWKRGSMDGKLHTWTCDALPNGCSAILYGEDEYGVRGGVRRFFGVTVFAPDGSQIAKRGCAYERWGCIRTAHRVAQDWGKAIAA